VSRFDGVWRMPDGQLRALERKGDQVDISKLDAVTGPRKFFRHYGFVAAEHGVAFASDEEMVDPRAADDASCHLSVHVEYRYDPDADQLALRKDKLVVDFVDGHCVVRSHDPDTSQLGRVDQAHENHVIVPPAGQAPKLDVKPIPKKPSQKLSKKVVPLDPQTPFNSVSKQTPRTVNTKQQAVDNVFQGGDGQQAQNAPAQPQPQQAPPVQRQKN